MLFAAVQSTIPWMPNVTASSSTFVVLSANWSSSSGAAGPGSTNVPLTVDIEYTGGTAANSVIGMLRLPAGFTDTSGNNTPITGTGVVSASSIFHLKYNLTIADKVSVGTYSMPIQFTWTTSAGGSLAVNAETDTFTLSLLGTVVLSFQPSQTSLNAGEVNAVAVTLSNSGTGTATQIKPSVSTSAGNVLTVLPVVTSLGGGSSTPLVVDVFVPSSSAGSAVILTFTTTYDDAYGNSEVATQAVGFHTVSAPEPILSFTSPSASLVPGQVNHVQIVLANLGPGDVTRVYATITASTGFSVLNQIPMVAALPAGTSVNATVRVFAPTSAAGTAATLTFAYSYVDPYGTSTFTSQTIGFYTLSASSIATSTSLAVVTSSNSLLTGEESPVSFTITNTGQQSVYSPTFSLSVPSGLAVTANSTYTRTGLKIAPGQSITYHANVTSGPETAEGAYTGTLVVTYTDQFGNQYSQTFSPGFVLVGSIDLVIQGLTATQADATSITVAGTLLNEGQSSAYYLQITGSVQGGATGTDYVGEVDPNTPLPFSVTVPYRASSSSAPQLNLTLLASYKNDYGQSLQYEHVIQVRLGVASQGSSLTTGSATGSSVSSSTADLLRYAVAAVIVIAVAASALYVRRTRSRNRASRKESSNVI